MHTIDHLGIAVKSLAQARKFYEQLGLQVSSEEVVAHEKVKVAMIPVGETRIELLEPTGPDSVIAKFLEKRGEGLPRASFLKRSRPAPAAICMCLCILPARAVCCWSWCKTRNTFETRRRKVSGGFVSFVLKTDFQKPSASSVPLCFKGFVFC